ncbi:hypothetical protein FNH05_21215 [Amycolatopsis rhizosphaerae]|uniref:Uncharacterized protein n=1 Tax=Amycolatopsis rhizosphaerae TaxID=2053003 RepID=A0A558C7L4_9PSEU|nr:hypothetical protein [Amycolatopsis rhizosphaerae]TVT44602.1 hypothetical protein FNH05_21215 [Amycolatopsis rhizosphaerae]
MARTRPSEAAIVSGDRQAAKGLLRVADGQPLRQRQVRQVQVEQQIRQLMRIVPVTRGPYPPGGQAGERSAMPWRRYVSRTNTSSYW